MSRTKYSVSFPSKRAGAEITWPNTVLVFPDRDAHQPLQEAYLENPSSPVLLWSESASVPFTCEGETLTCTTGAPTQTGADAAAGGGGGASEQSVIACPFDHSTAGLAAGAVLYTPTVGDVLLDAWIAVHDAWNGTTPLCDIGTFPSDTGVFNTYTGQTIPLSGSANDQPDGRTPLSLGSRFTSLREALLLASAASDEGEALLTTDGSSINLSGTALRDGVRLVPSSFISTDPIKVCVSQDGTNTGAATGATQGSATLYLHVATPVSAS